MNSNRRQEFKPEDLRLIGRLSWMKDGEQDHWFSVPSSDNQMVFNEDAKYVHGLSGIRLEVLMLDGHPGGYESYVLSTWSPFTSAENQGDKVKFSDLVQWGELFYRLLIGSGLEFWAADPDFILEWTADNVLLIDENQNPELARRSTLKSRVQELNLSLLRKRKNRRAVVDSSELCNRRDRKVLKERRIQWRKEPLYDEVFVEIFGKSQSAIDEHDPKQLVSYAHMIAEYRLGLGRWDPADQGATDALNAV